MHASPSKAAAEHSNGGAAAEADRRNSQRERAYARGISPRPQSASRSRNMQAIRRRDTKPELTLRRALHSSGLRYRVDMRLDLPAGRVRPDVVFTRRKIAVFVDSCFWHSCPQHGHVPAVNEWFWVPKLERTAARDLQANEILRAAGWTVVRVWEHDELDAAVAAVVNALKSTSDES